MVIVWLWLELGLGLGLELWLGSGLGLGCELTEAAALGPGVGERLHLNRLEALCGRQPTVVRGRLVAGSWQVRSRFVVGS